MTPSGRRWIRLDATWEDSEWLDALDGSAAGCWPRLLCMVKRDGIKGRCKRPTLGVLARRWRVPLEAVQALEAAAVEHGAVRIEDGNWVVVEWSEYQDTDPTAKERVKRYRKDKSRLSPLRVTHRNQPLPGVTLSRDIDSDIDKKRESARASKRCPPDWQPSEEHRALAIERDASLAFEVEKFRDHTFRDPRSDWDATFRNWLRRIEVPSSNGSHNETVVILKPGEVFQ